nr:uncharacterized protein si:ch211-153b23.3 isoform X2 [Nerophis lumbriciformis]
MATIDGFPASFYSEPGVLGMLSNGISAFLVLLQNFGTAHTGIAPQGVENILAGVHLILIGGVCQLVAGLLSFRKYDHLSATAFVGYAALWGSFGATRIYFEDANVTSGRNPMVGNWFFVVAALVLCIGSLSMDALELVHNILFLLLTISTIPQIPLKDYYIFFGVACSIFTAASLYGTFSRLINTIAEKLLIPVGPQPVSTAQLKRVFNWSRSTETKQELTIQTDQASDALFYLVNGVAALSALHASVNSTNSSFLHLTIPWVLISGAIIQAYVSRLKVTGASQFGSVISSVYVAVWATWTWFRFAGQLLQLSNEVAYEFTAGAIAFLVINGFVIFSATYRNLVLVFLTATMEVILVCLLLSTLQQLPYQLEMAMLAIFSIICLYGAMASLLNSIFSQRLLPLGPPLFKEQMKQDREQELPCPLANSKLTSGLLKIAAILEKGGVCGIPTDTVYALAASCKNPQAIENIYNIKDRPAEKPICICISSVKQLVEAKPPFSPLLWEFMRNVYPGGISCIVSKGDWLLRLGVGPAYDRVGTRDSIMIRVPDHTVTRHLCDITGPLAITSANPSGEADSTHHNMVIDRLGHKIQGVLCDGETNEVVASTVVNCLSIDEGTITIVREGCVPAVKVREIFDRVKGTTA